MIRGAIGNWLAALWPAPLAADARERLRAAAGALLGLLLTGFIARSVGGAFALDPWLVAPIGASAVLVFGVPGSPLAQPWAVIAGNTLSTLVGILCVRVLPGPLPAAACAIGLAIVTMFWLRCLHPPGGAAALLAVLSDWTDPLRAVFPIATDCVLLVLAGVLFNSLTGRRYPHTQVKPPEMTGSRFSESDLDAALKHYNQVLDVSRDDLSALLHEAEAIAYRRGLGELRCGDIMTRELVTADYGMPLHEAWRLMRERRIKALPVIDRARRIVGIVTVADFMRHAQLDSADGLGARLRELVRISGLSHNDRPEAVGQIMTRKVRVARADWHVIELVPLFSEGGHHHIPILDVEDRVVGIITQSDLVSALYREVRP